jgi:hypothetical protein
MYPDCPSCGDRLMPLPGRGLLFLADRYVCEGCGRSALVPRWRSDRFFGLKMFSLAVAIALGTLLNLLTGGVR